MADDAGPAPGAPVPAAPAGLLQALVLWWKLGWLSFGGPAGQIALMHSEIVERRGWVDEAAFLHGLNYCMLLPGPEATQLATYLGWRSHGLAGGVLAGALFVLPGALVIGLLAWAYVMFGEAPMVAGVMLGVQAGVLGIIAHAIGRIGRRVLGSGFAVALAVGALVAIGLLSVPFPAIIAIAAVLGLVRARVRPPQAPVRPPAGAADAAVDVPARPVPPRAIRHSLLVAMGFLAAWWLPVLGLTLWLGTQSTAVAQALFFSKAAVVTFGGAYAVLPYVAQHAVEVQQWLQPGQMLVGLGLAESTPGPLILVLEFVGFVGAWQQPDLASPVASALLGAAITTWVTFVPSFLFVLPAAPWIERLGQWPLASAALTAISAAVVGVIAHLALWFGWQLLAPGPVAQQVFVLVLAALSLWALGWKQVSVLWLVPLCALAGAAYALAGL